MRSFADELSRVLKIFMMVIGALLLGAGLLFLFIPGLIVRIIRLAISVICIGVGLVFVLLAVMLCAKRQGNDGGNL